MSTTKAWFYGGHEFLDPSSGPVQLSYQRGRVKVLDPQAASIEFRLPPTREVPYTGFSVMLIVNTSNTHSVDIRNTSGTTTGITGGTTIGTNQMAKVGLLTKTPGDDGTWLLRIQNINEAVGPLPDYLVTAGGIGADLTLTRLFTPNTEVFSSGVAVTSKTYPNGFREAGFGYSQGRTTGDLAALDEYVFNTWTNRTSAGETRNDGDAVADVSGKGIIYFDRVTGAPLGPVEEYSRTGDSWTSLNEGFVGGSDESDDMSARGRGGFGYIAMGLAVTSGNEFVKHTRSGDSYSALIEIVGEHPREAPALWINRNVDLHQAGGSTSATESAAHNKFDLDTEAGWTSLTAIPTTGQGVRGASAAPYPTNDKVALFWHGNWDNAGEFKTLKWDDVLASWVTGIGDPPGVGNGLAQMNKNNFSVPQP